MPGVFDGFNHNQEKQSGVWSGAWSSHSYHSRMRLFGCLSVLFVL